MCWSWMKKKFWLWRNYGPRLTKVINLEKSCQKKKCNQRSKNHVSVDFDFLLANLGEIWMFFHQLVETLRSMRVVRKGLNTWNIPKYVEMFQGFKDHALRSMRSQCVWFLFFMDLFNYFFEIWIENCIFYSNLKKIVK